ncbi:zinc ribbon domain-containing protein [Citricoccus alkalitolerans]|uniref:Zinc ribbon domain-containing protein n=1 Tax=Citricoccus alkalitolerans TaxID=246603 RepID=A0ABV8XTS2_9MICC
MASVPDSLDCPRCGEVASRRISGVRLSHSGSAAYRLIEDTRRSAESPEVVNSLPAAPSPARPRKEPTYTGNPQHLKLPRP